MPNNSVGETLLESGADGYGANSFLSLFALVTGNDMSTFTRFDKDNTMQGGDGQRQAGDAMETKRKENKDVLIS